MQLLNTFNFKFFFVSVALFYSACKSKPIGVDRENRNQKPDWVMQRPVNNNYYIGVGYANKSLNPIDYQDVAKKRALTDLISEIKVVVSSNSLLSQYQSNADASQIFASSIKVNAQAMVEDFQVVDSWENNIDFYIYYKLSKAEYEAAKKRKLRAAVEQSIHFLDEADNLSIENNYMQIMRLRIKALNALQNYLNEDVATIYKGKNVFLVNEIVSQIQAQLYKLEVKTDVVELKGKIGKPINKPFEATVNLVKTNIFVPFVPLTLKASQTKFDFGNTSETNQMGKATFLLNKIQAKDPLQQVKIMVDIVTMIKSDSLNAVLKNILTNIDAPSASFRLMVEPIKIFTNSQEQILSKNLALTIIEPKLKNRLVESGCVFVNDLSKADYEIKIVANTTDEGIMWGKMLQASINFSIGVYDAENHTEIFKDVLKDVKGFQLTAENASRDAYKNLLEKFWEQVYPNLLNELTLKER